ncbi:MAG: serine/threonine-protein kinase [Planctomycetales bacterium]|nr:serine/threonine-protein kinase [Planctomycetales bacterium]
MTDDDIFIKAIEFPDAADRTRYLDMACDGNEAQKARVASLLRAHEEASRFLTTPAMSELRAQVQEIRDSHLESEQDKASLGAADEATVQTADLRNQQLGASEPEDDDRETVDEEFKKYLSPSTRPNWLGRLAHYEIEAILGHGAFGVVAKAFDEKLHRVVAIKMLRPELATISPPRKRFIREARTAAAVTHENIVGIYAVEEDPVPYLVMEFVPGQTLQARLNQKGPLEIPELLTIALQVARGLAAAHNAKLIHRDIKPANILLTCDPVDRTKISDFGLARAVDDASLTSSGLIAGTPLYMAPEQARGETLDSRADLFSLGSVMYQMVCGRPPFRAATTMAVLKRVCEDTPRPIKDLIPEAPEWLCAIISRLLEKDRDDRFQTAEEVVEILERCQRELLASGVVSFPVRRNANRRTANDSWRSRLSISQIVSIFALLILIPAAYWLLRGRGEANSETNTPPDSVKANVASAGLSSSVGSDTASQSESDTQSLLWTNGRLVSGQIRTIANSTPESYRLEFSIRGNDSKMFMVVFPIAGRQACLTFGGFREKGAPLYGLEKIDGKGLFEIFPNAVGDFFVDNQSHRISLTVTPTSVSATLDGKPIVNWTGDASQLSTYDWLRPHLYGRLFINPFGSEWEITDLTLEPLSDPTQQTSTDQEIINLVRSAGGRMTLGEPPFAGTSLTAIENPRPLSSDVVHFDFRRSKLNEGKEFGDEQLTRLAELLELRPDIKIGVLNLVGTSVSNTGLLTLEQVPVTELMIYNTRVNGNQIAEQLATFPISDWDFGSSISSDSLAVLAKNPNLRGISLDSETVDAQSLSVFANSKLRRLQLFGRENRSLPTVDQLSGLTELTDLFLPNYELGSDPNMLRSLQESLPGVNIHTKSYTDRLPLPREYPESDLDIISLVESVGGEIHQYRPEGLVRVRAANNRTLARSNGAINIYASSKPEFDDSKLLELTAILKHRPDIDLICLHFPGTPISNVGLRSLKDFKISQLFCNHTMVNGDEIANEAPEFKVREWGHVPGLTELGFSKFLESPHVIAIDIPSADVTPTVIRIAAESNLRHFGMIDLNASDLPPAQLFSVLTEIQVLALQSTDEIPQEYLQDLHVQVPQAEIRCGARTIPPDDGAIQARLFAGRQISNGIVTPIAREVPHSYLLEFKARRITGEDAIGIRFPIADSAAAILFSAFTDHTGGLSGLTLVDGVDLPGSPHTKRGNPFADGKDHVIRIVVTPRTVTATLDNMEYVQWEGDPGRLKPYAWLEGEKTPLFIKTWADFYVSELKLEAIDSAELTEPSEEKPIDAK